jgi:hypothetical protein
LLAAEHVSEVWWRCLPRRARRRRLVTLVPLLDPEIRNSPG